MSIRFKRSPERTSTKFYFWTKEDAAENKWSNNAALHHFAKVSVCRKQFQVQISSQFKKGLKNVLEKEFLHVVADQTRVANGASFCKWASFWSRTRAESDIHLWSPIQAPKLNLLNKSRYSQLQGIKSVVCGYSCTYTALSHPK